MKIYLYFFICLAFISCRQVEKSEESIKQDTVANLTSVEQIKQHFGTLNEKLQRGLLDSVSFKYDCNGERSGTVTYFSDKGKLAIIKHSYNEYSHFSAVDQYFINDNNLFFAYFNRLNWSFESGQAAEGATKDDITEQRFYIAKEKSLLCLEKTYTKRSHAAENPSPAHVQNKEVKCETIEPVLKDFYNLIVFRESANHDCLSK